MKHILLTALLMSLIVSIAQARGPGPKDGNRHEGPRGNPAARLTEELGLDEGQATQIETIFEEAREQHVGQREQSDEAFCAIRAATHARVLAVLNDEQRSAFETHRSEGRGQRPGHMAKQGERGKGNKGKRQGRGPGRSGDRPGPPDCDF